MIYEQPAPQDFIDQGDLIDNCPILTIRSIDLARLSPPAIDVLWLRAIVLTQTCDLAQNKTTTVTIAEVFDAEELVTQGLLKSATIKGPVRAGRIWGWYFLPSAPNLGLPEMIVYLHRVHTVGIDLLRNLCQAGKRRGRVQPLYREHLAKHFADTYSRIGLPRPYETM